MISGFGWAALALLFGYLALFFWGSALAAQAAGRPVWLFARATGRDRHLQRDRLGRKGLGPGQTLGTQGGKHGGAGQDGAAMEHEAVSRKV